LIATDVVSRGMDFKGVNCVINYDFPDSASAYVHRIGMCSYINFALDLQFVLFSWRLLFPKSTNYYYLLTYFVFIRSFWQSREDWRSDYFLHRKTFHSCGMLLILWQHRAVKFHPGSWSCRKRSGRSTGPKEIQSQQNQKQHRKGEHEFNPEISCTIYMLTG